MATFAFFLLSHGRNTVVIRCERGITVSPPWHEVLMSDPTVEGHIIMIDAGIHC